MTSKKAFTLIEILVSVMLTGILTTLALAPVVMTVRQVVQTQSDYNDISALRRAMNFIERDLQSAMRLAPNVITITDHESMGGLDDDTLMIMSSSPTVQNMPAGTLVYKIIEGGILHGNVIQGLYRWVLPGKTPGNVDAEALEPEDAQLVLPDVKIFGVEIPNGSHEDDRQKEYSGKLPDGIYIKIGRGNNDNDKNEDRRNKIESFIVFP